MGLTCTEIKVEIKTEIWAQSAGAEEYTVYIFAKGYDPPPATEYPRYDTKQSDVLLELWGIWSTPSLPSLPVTLWPGDIAPDMVLSICRIELFHI